MPPSVPLSQYAVVVVPQATRALRADNVAVAKRDIPSALVLDSDGSTIRVPSAVARGASFAIRSIPRGESIIALGVHVGFARVDIPPGGVLDPQDPGNMVHELASADPQIGRLAVPTRYRPELQSRTFMGFRRQVTPDSREGAGTQNLVIILNTVKCSQPAALNLAARARRELLPHYPHVTDIVAITQEYGCGMPAGRAQEELIRLFLRIMNHPNVAATFLLGLGCERLCPVAGVEGCILPDLERGVVAFPERVRVGHLQGYASEWDAVDHILNGPLQELLERANRSRREALPIGYLTLGVKCGGSDRFSGVTANPALGVAADRLIEGGGAAVITETPEFEGYMHVMAERASSADVGRWLLGLLPRFDALSRRYPIPESGRQTVAPGNLAGGLVNIFMKAAGAAAKSGSTRVEGGLEYGESICEQGRRGLWVLDGPSYDQISTPALGLAGCQIVAFTTGRGTAMGSALSQVFKIASTRDVGLADHIDFFADGILHGQSVQEVGEALLDRILAVASGAETTAAERWNRRCHEAGLSGLHQEFMLWKRWPDN